MDRFRHHNNIRNSTVRLLLEDIYSYKGRTKVNEIINFLIHEVKNIVCP